MKNMRKVLVILCALALLVACVAPTAASSITRKFNGFHAVNKDNPNLYTTDGKSSYANGVVTCEFPKVGAGCWQYITDVEDLHFQFRIDTSVDPEFDWLGLNITTDGEAFLGEGTGLSTLIWRTSDSVNCRVVNTPGGAGWDQVANQELMSGELYTGESAALTEPYEDYRWGDGDWIDFELDKDKNGAWHVYINGIDIIRTPYKNFDKDMNDIFGKASRVTLSLFLSNASGVVEVRGVDDSAATTTKAPAGTTTKAPAGTTTKAPAGNNNTTTKAPEAGDTTTAQSGDTTTAVDGDTTTAAEGDTTTAAAGDATDAVTDGTQSTADNDETPDDNKGDVQTGTTGAEDDGDKDGGFPVWAIVLIAVVVVAGAAVAVVFFVKKK